MVGYAKTNNMHTVTLIMCLKEDFDEEETSANTRKKPRGFTLKRYIFRKTTGEGLN